MTLVAVPLAVGSIVHLYPDAFVNVIVLVPTLMWSMYLAVPRLADRAEDGPRPRHADGVVVDRVLLVSWVTLLCITAVLWSRGVGPRVARS